MLMKQALSSLSISPSTVYILFWNLNYHFFLLVLMLLVSHVRPFCYDHSHELSLCFETYISWAITFWSMIYLGLTFEHNVNKSSSSFICISITFPSMLTLGFLVLCLKSSIRSKPKWMCADLLRCPSLRLTSYLFSVLGQWTSYLLSVFYQPLWKQWPIYWNYLVRVNRCTIPRN